MPGRIKAVCPELIKSKEIESLNNIEINENPNFLNAYTNKGTVNGHKTDILRDTGATIDFICEKYINPSSLTGENVWVESLLRLELVRMPLAIVKASGCFSTVQTKATVCKNKFKRPDRLLTTQTRSACVVYPMAAYSIIRCRAYMLESDASRPRAFSSVPSDTSITMLYGTCLKRRRSATPISSF
ncbi:hypothetical protein TNCV_5083221 [Trichonephila clavipes]|nr:hypothetical protein TNCV_5083221 [Trichonephila clavipes]